MSSPVHRWECTIDRKRIDADGHEVFGACIRSLDGYPMRCGSVWLDRFGPPVDRPRPGLRFRWWVGKDVDRVSVIP